MANRFYYAAPPAENKPLHLLLAGITDPGDTFLQNRDRTSPIYVFQYITGGCGVLSEETLPETACGEGDFLITHAWRAHHYYPVKKNPWSKGWINITGPFPESILRCYGLLEQCIFRNASDAGKLLMHAIPIIPELPVDQVDCFTENLLMRIVRLLREQTVQQKEDPQKEKAEKIRRFLLGFLMKQPPSLDEICAAAALSPAQTIRVFKKYFKKTPYSYLLDAKIHAAANALTQTSAPIRETAEEFGFKNVYYFSRLFHQRIGIAPGACRRPSQP